MYNLRLTKKHSLYHALKMIRNIMIAPVFELKDITISDFSLFSCHLHEEYSIKIRYLSLTNNKPVLSIKKSSGRVLCTSLLSQFDGCPISLIICLISDSTSSKCFHSEKFSLSQFFFPHSLPKISKIVN